MTGAWDDLVAGAVLGTERRPFTGAALPGPLAAIGSSGGLGRAAAALWAYRQAGRRPEPAGPGRPAAAPPDHRPLLPAPTLRTLTAILEDPMLRPVLAEWLSLAAADGRRLPPEWIPDLLGACQPASRADLEAAAGRRAGWLAALNPDWSTDARATARRRRPPAPDPGRPKPSDADLAQGIAQAPLADSLPALAAAARPWSPAVSRAVLDALRALIASGDSTGAAPVRDALGRMAGAVWPGLAPGVAALVDEVERMTEAPAAGARVYWGRPLSRFAAVVHFRQTMYQEFR